ncbi:hypothetical protein A5904_06225 [Acidithiobacillus caldus]|uniref:hypothetical protein n=1 Tax=Acidithiobacillus caldus TaxID=33059 RepID=UPI0005A087CB|nr:hypothetical protein [Acidithiobacillus caldus]AUW32606.1 hypothetical protein A5904_06225 [Acidithiobacillus caldus]
MRQIKSLLGTSCYGKKILVIAPKRPKLDGYITWRAAETREERVAAFQDTAASGPDIVIVDGASEDEINQYPENDGFSVYVGAKTKIKTLSATDRKDENNNSNKQCDDFLIGILLWALVDIMVLGFIYNLVVAILDPRESLKTFLCWIGISYLIYGILNHREKKVMGENTDTVLFASLAIFSIGLIFSPFINASYFDTYLLSLVIVSIGLSAWRIFFQSKREDGAGEDIALDHHKGDRNQHYEAHFPKNNHKEEHRADC